MTDSCNPRKLEPGLAQTKSNPRDLSTSTIKSDPGRSVVRASISDEGALAGSGEVNALAAGPEATVAAPPTAAFKKSRRSSGNFLYPMRLLRKKSFAPRAAAECSAQRMRQYFSSFHSSTSL